MIVNKIKFGQGFFYDLNVKLKQFHIAQTKCNYASSNQVSFADIS